MKRRSFCETSLFSASILLLALSFSLVFPTVSAAENFLLASEKDKNIRKLLGELLPMAEKQLLAWDADVAQVYHQRVFKAQDTSYEEYENYVWWVKRGEAEDITNYVVDYLPGVEVKKVKAFVIKPGEYGVDAALKAEIEELGKDRIHIQKGDDDEKLTNLVVAFDSAQPGDLFGISILTKVKSPLYWDSWLMASDEPAIRTELRVKCDWRLSYSVFGYGFPRGVMQQEVLEKDNQHITDLRIWADNIAPITYEPYSLPWFKQSPVLSVAMRASRFSFGSHNLWWTIADWNQIAANMSDSEIAYMKEKKGAAKQAAELAAGKPEQEQVAILYDFVRDELLEIHSSSFRQSYKDFGVDDILEARAGSGTQKTYLLLAMLRSVGLDAALVWAHDPHEGGFIKEYPSWHQLNSPLVKVHLKSGKKLWLDLLCQSCDPGQIHPRLRDTRAMMYDPNCGNDERELLEFCWAEASRKGKNPFGLYLKALKRVDWETPVKTPGNSKISIGWLKEKLQFKNTEDGMVSGSLAYRSWGINALSAKMGSLTDAGPAVKKRTKKRFTEWTDVSNADNYSVQGDTTTVALTVADLTVPSPMGDTWILPAELIFGEPTNKAWPETRRTRFHIGFNNDKEWETRIPLPENWDKVVLPEDQYFGIDLMQYMVTYKQTGAEIVIHRYLTERAGDVDDPAFLATIGVEMGKIHLFETSPLVLKRVVQ